MKEEHEGMTNTLDSTTDVEVGTSPVKHAYQTPVKTPRKHSVGHIVAIVIGCLALLPGLGILAGGTTLAIAQVAATDDAGYFRFTLDRVETDGMAVVTAHLWPDETGPWVLDWLDLDLRLRVEGAATSDEVFVGIARSADVDGYLSDASYSEVIDLDNRTPRYRDFSGALVVESPMNQDFWTASASGAGEQELTWDARGGRWSVVVTNVDGSPIVNADIEVGVKSGAVTPIAVALIVFGGIITVVAITLIVVGARGRRNRGSSRSTEPEMRTPFPPPPPNSAAANRLNENQPAEPTS
jgi:hypothetical protein